MNAERRVVVVSADGTGVALDSRGKAINPANMEEIDAYLDSVGMPTEFRSCAKMNLLGHKSDIPTVQRSEQRSGSPLDEHSPEFDADEWMTDALKRAAKVSEELSAPVVDYESRLFE
jgi:hypothetical protein